MHLAPCFSARSAGPAWHLARPYSERALERRPLLRCAHAAAGTVGRPRRVAERRTRAARAGQGYGYRVSEPNPNRRAQAKGRLAELAASVPIPHGTEGLVESCWLLLTSVVAVPIVCSFPGGSAVLGFLARARAPGPIRCPALPGPCSASLAGRAARRGGAPGRAGVGMVLRHARPLRAGRACTPCPHAPRHKPCARAAAGRRPPGCMPERPRLAARSWHPHPRRPWRVGGRRADRAARAGHRARRRGRAAPGRAGRRVPAVQHRAGAVAGPPALHAEVCVRAGLAAGARASPLSLRAPGGGHAGGCGIP